MIALIRSKLKILSFYGKKKRPVELMSVSSVLLNTWPLSHCQIFPLDDFLKIVKKQFSGNTVL